MCPCLQWLYLCCVLALFTLHLTGSFSGGGGAWWNPRPDGVHGEWHQLAQASFAHSVYIAYQHFCSEIQTKLSNTLQLFDLCAGFEVICTAWSLAVSWCSCRCCPSWIEFSCVVVVSCSMRSNPAIIFHGTIVNKNHKTHTYPCSRQFFIASGPGTLFMRVLGIGHAAVWTPGVMHLADGRLKQCTCTKLTCMTLFTNQKAVPDRG